MNEECDPSPTYRTIDKVLKNLISSIIQQLNLDSSKSLQLHNSLSHLADIKYIYSQSDEDLYKTTLEKISSISLFDFEAKVLLEQLIDKFFSRMSLFRQSYQIAQLKSTQQKYRKLTVEQPIIELTIPCPYICLPLSQAKFIGEVQCVKFEDIEQQK